LQVNQARNCNQMSQTEQHSLHMYIPRFPTALLERQSWPGEQLVGNFRQSRGEMEGNTHV